MKLTVLFPGIGYHTDKPLLYYSKKLAAGYARKYDLNVKHIFFTPFVGTFKVLPESNPCIVFHGKDDPWASDWDIRNACKEVSCSEYAFDKANHSIETEEAETDIQNLAKIMEIVKSALSENGVSGVWIREEPELSEFAKERIKQNKKSRNSKKKREEREAVEKWVDTLQRMDADFFARAEESWLRPPD